MRLDNTMSDAPRRVNLRALGAATVAAALFLTGCAAEAPSEEEGPVEIRMTWWGSDARHERTNAAIDLFEEKYPNITVVREPAGFEGYRDKLLTQSAAGNAPDVFQFYDDILREFGDRGQLLDLNTLAPEPLSLEGWPESVLDSILIDGEVRALPFSVTTQAVSYNTVAFETYGVDAPTDDWTWDDFAETAQAITDASGGAVYGTSDWSGFNQAFEVWAKQAGGDFIDDQGLAFSKEDLASWWELWADLRESGAAVPADVAAEYPTNYDALVAGRTAMGFSTANVLQAIQSQTADNVDAVRAPSDADTPGSYLRTAMTLAVAKTSEHPEAAGLLINFLVNDPEATAILGIERGIPLNPTVIDAATEGADETAQEFVRLVESVRENGAPSPVPPVAGAGEVIALFTEYSQRVAFGQLSVDDAVDEFFAAAESTFGR